MALKKRGRDRLYIIAKILSVIRKGALKTQIMYKANLSFAQLNEYLALLLETDLVKSFDKDGRTIYTVSKKGLRYLSNYGRISDLLVPTSSEDDFRDEKDPFTIQLKISELKRAIERLQDSLALTGKCSNCGKYIFLDFEFCPYCGESLVPVKSVHVAERKHI